MLANAFYFHRAAYVPRSKIKRTRYFFLLSPFFFSSCFARVAFLFWLALFSPLPSKCCEPTFLRERGREIEGMIVPRSSKVYDVQFKLDRWKESRYLKSDAFRKVETRDRKTIEKGGIPSIRWQRNQSSSILFSSFFFLRIDSLCLLPSVFSQLAGNEGVIISLGQRSRKQRLVKS